MKLQIEKRINYTFVKVEEGRLDIFSTSQLKDKLFSLVQIKGERNIVLDLCGCSFCDTSGLAMIVELHRICNDAGGRMTLTSVPENIGKLLKICKLDAVLFICNSLDEVEIESERNARIV